MPSTEEIADALFTEVLPEEPITFNQKVRWRMRYDRRSLLTITADKDEVYNYLTRKGFAHLLKKRYFVTADPETIRFDTLPSQYVIKSTHSSGDVIIVDNGIDLTTMETVDRESIIKECKMFLGRQHWNRRNEWAYQNIKPKIIIEELLLDDGMVPTDYKFFCFDGVPRVVKVIEQRYSDESDSFFDMDWKQFHFTCPNWPGTPGREPTTIPEKPENFEELKHIASALSKPLGDFVRVDLYNIEKRPYFGEFTHYPSAGIGEFNPVFYDHLLGSYWKLSKAGPSGIINRLERFIDGISLFPVFGFNRRK